ncbi:MAG TPA: helix-turn-helix domain-containing protein [Novosphingobium sp.]|nr:helix-turn-helix domain-containing protein [Novosphingobium sp.]HPZ46371.1 helix-turn-helix domain-containing protein [Novosphingobium sp.]HQD98739.1 helix-turn-helix domain-containing protein [Novosphingobium sp.]
MKSAMRTFEVLELFAERRTPLHLNEIYTALQYPQSSTTNLLKSMVMMGYLNYNRAKRTYLPTTRISMLGNWLPGYIQASGGYRQLAEELQRRTDETVGLVSQNDLYVQYIIMLAPEHEYKAPPNPGAMRLMIDSSTGLTLMARMKDREIEKIWRYTYYYKLDEGNPISLADLMREVNWVRQVGYAYVPKRPTPQVSSIAMALDGDLFGMPMAIGVGGMVDRIAANHQSIIETMRELIQDFAAGKFQPEASLPPPETAIWE